MSHMPHGFIYRSHANNQIKEFIIKQFGFKQYHHTCILQLFCSICIYVQQLIVFKHLIGKSKILYLLIINALFLNEHGHLVPSKVHEIPWILRFTNNIVAQN